ncbi:hypothetical protein OPQ81_007812 [Rhizoctonia solani]|nr:hypothetical protein OPQ81_007812 [Rhizoctonia solani]
MSAALTLTIALALAGFCLVLASQMIFRLLRGQTTIEALQAGKLSGREDTPGRFLWLPSRNHPQTTDLSHQVTPIGISIMAEGIRHRAPLSYDPLRTRGLIVPLDPNTRIYDLGIWQNAKTHWSRPMFPPRSPTQTLPEPPEINPDIIGRINKASTDLVRGI